MTDFPFHIVGFDLDGTVLDTSRSLTDAVNFALAHANRPLLGVEEVKPMIGGGAKHMLEQGMAATGGCEPDELKRLYLMMLENYEANISAATIPFAGALEALNALNSLGVKTAIVTNKFERFAVKLLGELDMLGRFVTVIGGDTLGKGNAKPSAAPIVEMVARCGGGRAVFVGDSIYDIMAAKNAGLPNIACSFGFLMQPVEELKADLVIDHFDELLPALRRLA